METISKIGSIKFPLRLFLANQANRNKTKTNLTNATLRLHNLYIFTNHKHFKQIFAN